MIKMLVNFCSTGLVFLCEVRALWVHSSRADAQGFRLRGGAERLDELEAERQEFDTVIDRYEQERRELNADIEYLRGDNQALKNRNDALLTERTALRANKAELVARLKALTPEEIAAVVVRGRAIAQQNARLDALAKMAYESQPMKAGSQLN